MRPSNLFNIFWGRAPATPARYLTMNVRHGSVPPHTATLFFTRFVSNVELTGWMPYVSPKHSWRNLGSSAPCWCSRAPSSCRYIPDSAQALRSFPRRAWSSRHRPKNIPERIKGGDHWGNPLPTWKKPHQKGNVVELSSPPGISKKNNSNKNSWASLGLRLELWVPGVFHTKSRASHNKHLLGFGIPINRNIPLLRTFESDILFLVHHHPASKKYVWSADRILRTMLPA